MKKILLVVLLIITISKVKADEYFWSSEKLDDYKAVEEEKRYRFYREEKEGEYLKKGGSSLYEHEDLEDVIYKDLGDFQDSCTESDTVIVETKKVYPYKKIPKAKYMQISNIPRELKIKKIDIYSSDEKISYDITRCNKCNDMTISAGGDMELTFDVPQVVGYLKLNIEVDGSDNFAYYTHFQSENRINLISNKLLSSKTEFKIDSYNYLYNNLKEVYYSEEPISRDYLNYPLEEKEMCKEKEVQTYHYNINKVYYDDNYYVSVEDSTYQKDEDDYKVFYKYLSIDKSTEEKYEYQVDRVAPKKESDKKNYVQQIEEHPVATGYQGKAKKQTYILIGQALVLILSISIFLKTKKMSS